MATLLHIEKVLSSNNKDWYIVNVWEDYTADCSCLGFYHRHYCRHIPVVLLKLIEKVNQEAAEFSLRKAQAIHEES